MQRRHKRLLIKLLITIKMLKIFFIVHQKLIKSEPKTEESIAERVKLKNNMTAEIKEEQKNIDNLLFNYYFIKYQSPSDMYKKLPETKGKKNEDQVYSIKEILDQIKKSNKSAKKYMIKKTKM